MGGPSAHDALTALANQYGSDKGDRRRNRHAYSRIYGQYFRDWRDRALTLLEIGLCHPEDPSWRPPEGVEGKGAPHEGGWTGTKAPSLRMWARWFRAGRIIGFDINDFSGIALPRRCEVVRGDASSPDDLARLASFGPFDVIIDDASHASPHQQTALGVLWPSLKPGGLYIVEDLHWQPPALERSDVPTTRTLLRRLQVTGELATPMIPAALAKAIVGETANVALYDSLEPAELHQYDPTAVADALAVITKQAA